ncbi:hypothetical protein ACFL6X_03490 [Candidatus Latescibacterota bacterium]
MSVGTIDEIAVLEQQHQDYKAMHAVSLSQRDCLKREDLEGVNASGARMHDLMNRIRLRQKELPDEVGMGHEPDVRVWTEAIRHTIRQILEVRQANEDTLRGMMVQTRREMQQFAQGRRAARGYRHQKVEEARFYDGSR